MCRDFTTSQCSKHHTSAIHLNWFFQDGIGTGYNVNNRFGEMLHSCASRTPVILNFIQNIFSSQPLLLSFPNSQQDPYIQAANTFILKNKVFIHVNSALFFFLLWTTSAFWIMKRPTGERQWLHSQRTLEMSLLLPISHWSLLMKTSKRGWRIQRKKTPS